MTPLRYKACWDILPFTPRSHGLLGTQLAYSDGSFLSMKSIEEKKTYMVNPNFVEFLMGYPKDHTKPTKVT